MFITANTIDDLLNDVITELLKIPFDVSPTKGKNSEIFGILLELTNPKARLSISETRGRAFSTLGEFFWYMSKSNDLNFIEYYIPIYKKFSDDGKTVFGGYGPRLFAMYGKHDQIKNITDLLKKSPMSRRAVIQLFSAEDLEEKHSDVPCTCTLQFVIRHNKLHLFTTMRSNDSFLGLPHDIFCFTMLQEIIAMELNVELGLYRHAIGSLHLYEKDKLLAEQYLDEGFQSLKGVMPDMPKGSQWIELNKVLENEEKIRLNNEFDISDYDLSVYWTDIVHLLQIFKMQKKQDIESMKTERNKISEPIYKTYIDKKIQDSLGKFAPQK